jgi:hypothetical protein
VETRSIRNRNAQPRSYPGFADTNALDIELPFRTRAADETGQQREERRAAARVHEESEQARPTPVCVHLALLDELMAAPRGPYGLEVEVKQDERVVGTWELEVNLRNACEVYVSQARAALHVCVSARGDPRATGAFLVLRHWWVNAGVQEQVSQLYDELIVAILARLNSLTEHVPEHAEAMPPYVLYLIDGRNRKVKIFSLARLAADLLKALGEDEAVPKLRLKIAYGKGLGSSPAAPTTPADFAGLDEPVIPEPPVAVPWSSAAARRVVPGPVFVREQLSAENLRWASLFETRLA